MASIDNSDNHRTSASELSICPILKQRSKINRIGHKRVLLGYVGILLVLLMLNFASAITGTIGNARAVLYPEVGFWGTTIDRTISIENVNDEPINVTLDAGNSTIINIVDKSFILEPGQSKDAEFQIKLKKAGDYTEKISIFFSPIDGKGAGVALSSTLIIHAKAKGEQNDEDVNGSVSVGDSEPAVTDEQDTETDNTKNTNFFENNKNVVIASISTLVLAILLVMLMALSKKSKKEGKLNKKRSEKIR